MKPEDILAKGKTDKGKRQVGLENAVRMFPTPSAQTYGTNQGGGMGRVGPVRESLETMARNGRWPTPTAGDAKQSGAAAYSTESGRHAGTTLTDAIRMWPTPAARDWKSGRSNLIGTNARPLSEVVLVWPTPRAADSIKGRRTPEGAAKERARTNGPDLPAMAGGSLNPTWVEWLMGFPLGWTDCAASVTESYRLWLRGHSEC